jgi:hypothetical protein
MPSRRTAHILAVLAAASALTACGSVGPGPAERRRPQAGFVVQSSDWLTGAMTTTERTDDAGRSAYAPVNPALQPDGPWLGTIGVRSLLPGSYEYGFGVCLPNSAISYLEQQIAPDPLRSIAVGVWVKFDF